MKINGVQHDLWRAVDHEGEVLESYVTKTRDTSAALKFLRKAMKRYGAPRTIVADRLKSYGAAMKEIGNADLLAVGISDVIHRRAIGSKPISYDGSRRAIALHRFSEKLQSR